MDEWIISRPTSIFKVVLASSLGGCLELYDFVIYIFFAPIISELFFPHEHTGLGLLSTFSVFAAGYLIRPVGGIIFGYYGDKFGRKKSLLFTIALMGGCTVLIGCLPTYDHIGVLAPILLTVLRLIQGIAVGGDLPGSMTFVGEMSPVKRRGLNTSWIYFGVNCGNLLASATASLIIYVFAANHVTTWGWRLGFFSGAIILLLGIYFRSTSDESILFLALKQRKLLLPNPVSKAFDKQNYLTLLKGIGLVWLWAVIVAQIYLYMPTYLRLHVGFSMDKSLWYNTANLMLFTCLIPIFGKLSDVLGRKMMGIGIVTTWLLFVFPCYELILHHHIILSLCIMTMLAAMFVALTPGLLVELFGTNVRYTGIGFSYNMGFALFGGLTPLALSYLLDKIDNPILVSLNIMLAAAVALFSLLTTKNGTGKELP